MFSWASSTLESLAQTVAPPPSDPPSKIYTACQRKDEVGAIELLQQNHMDPIHAIIYPAKGYTTVHLACLYSLPRLLQFCMDQSLPFLHVLDQEGNTPLHCAAMSNQSNALDIVKVLVSLDASAVVVQNRSGQTPYDVAQLNTVRQHLLPLQLQAETQRALDNGGVGLPPGIDLGGLKVTNSNLAPPPIMPTMNVNITASAPTSLYPPIPGMPTTSTMPSSSSYPSASTPVSVSAYGSGIPPPQSSSSSIPVPESLGGATVTTPTAPVSGPTIGTPVEPSPSSNNYYTAPEGTLPRPPTSNGSSHSYALTGRSSAAILKSKTGIQPDGFHSSSSDKNLQEKYGHVTALHNPAVPPPPSSGNFSGIMEHTVAAAGGIQSAPPSMMATTNPFAGGLSTLGAAAGARASARRYVAYDHGSSMPRSNSGPYSQPPPSAVAHAPAPASYTPYVNNSHQYPSQPVQPLPQNPYVFASNSSMSESVYTQPTPPNNNNVTFMIPQQTSLPTNFSSPPPASIGKTPANTPMLSSGGANPKEMSPPPSGFATTPSVIAPRSFASSSSPDRSTGSQNAAAVFGTAPTAISGYHRSSSAPMEASALFSRPPNAAPAPVDSSNGVLLSTPSLPRAVAGSAAELFGTAPNTTAAAGFEKVPTSTANEDEDDLDDVPLTPGPEKEIPRTDDLISEDVPPPANVTDQRTNEPASIMATGMNSLIAAIGMPPPPFSKK